MIFVLTSVTRNLVVGGFHRTNAWEVRDFCLDMVLMISWWPEVFPSSKGDIQCWSLSTQSSYFGSIGWKKIFHANENQKNAAVTKHISDKINFKQCYKRQWRTLHNDQRINPRIRYTNYKYLCAQQRSTFIHQTNAKSHKRGKQQ